MAISSSLGLRGVSVKIDDLIFREALSYKLGNEILNGSVSLNTEQLEAFVLFLRKTNMD